MKPDYKLEMATLKDKSLGLVRDLARDVLEGDTEEGLEALMRYVVPLLGERWGKVRLEDVMPLEDAEEENKK